MHHSFHAPPALCSGWVTPDIAQMQPLPCPQGFRRARDADHALLVSFLDAEFNRAQRGSEIRTDLPDFYCRAGVDPASKSYSAVNGCVSLEPNVRRCRGVVGRGGCEGDSCTAAASCRASMTCRYASRHTTTCLLTCPLFPPSPPSLAGRLGVGRGRAVLPLQRQQDHPQAGRGGRRPVCVSLPALAATSTACGMTRL